MSNFSEDFGDFHEEYTVHRFVAGGTVDYEWVEGGRMSPDPVIRATFPPQPVSGKEMELIQQEDGEITGDTLKFYSESEVFTRRGSVSPDEIQFNGNSYKVLQVEPRGTLIKHWKVIFRKIQSGQS